MSQLERFLGTLGWTKYESLAYSTIVEYGPMKANDLAVKADIPSGRIYDVITSLLNKGWLKKTGSHPTIYDAQNPRLVLTQELDKMQKEMDESLAVAEQSWELRSGGIGSNGEKTWIVSGAHGLIVEFRNLMMKAEISIIISDSTIDWISSKDIRDLDLLVRKGILIKVLSAQQSRNTLEKLNIIGVETWVTDKPELSFYVIDEEIVMMKLSKPDVASIVKDKSISKLFNTKFIEMLKSSKIVKSENIAS